MRWLFGDFVLDQERRQLLRAGVPLPLELKAYELLSLLVDRRPRALSKAQIRDVLWPRMSVSDSAIAGVVADLRSAFGEDARQPSFIRTVHGFGYAFCGTAREDGPVSAPVSGGGLRFLVLSGSGSPRAFELPLGALDAALDEPAGAAVHVVEFTPGSPAPPLLQQLAGLAQRRQVLLSRAAFDLARDAQGEADGLTWLAHGPYLLGSLREPVDVFEVGRSGQSFLKPPPDTDTARRAVRPGDEETLGWRPAPGIAVPRRDGWTFVDKLGEGGFGEVWLSRHASGERRVFKFCFDASRLRSLKREATIFRILKDELGDRDDIARVLDWNFDEPPYFLESEYTEGGSLADWAQSIGGIGNVALETRLELIAQVAEALAAAHSVGVLHKDVKPRNVLIGEDENGRPKARLTDFGVGVVKDRSVLLGRDFTVTGFTGATADDRSGSGTRLYAAPEVLEGRTPTTLADVYAVGVMLYQVVVGDLERALAPGWERDVADEVLRQDIAACVEGRPERRLSNPLALAERLRSLTQRRAESEAPRRRRRRKLAWQAVGVLAAVGVAVMLFRLGVTAATRPALRFHRVTSQSGGTGNGRFTADGQTIVYCRWGKRPTEVFLNRLDSVEPRALGLEAGVAATAAGEILVILTNGTLARLPLEGGIPREIAENVNAADWGPNGQLAVMRERRRIEYPLGHLFYEADASTVLRTEMRVSPRGDRVALIEHPILALHPHGLEPPPGHVVVVDGQGRKVVSSLWASIGGLAWRPDGQEVWFTATNTGSTSALQAMSVAGRERLVAEMGVTMYLHDISRDGRVLVVLARISAETRGRMADDKAERDYSWLDGTSSPRFAADGRFFVFSEVGDGGGPGQRAYVRRTDGSPAVWLGNGAALDISPDGKSVVCLSHGSAAELSLVPAGAGDARPLRRGMIKGRFTRALFLPDSQGLVIEASSTGLPTRLFLQPLPDGEPRPLTGEGVQALSAISPDGRFVVAQGPEHWALYPVEGGEPRSIPGLVTDDMPLRFAGDGAGLFVAEKASLLPEPLRIVRLDLATGDKRPWLTLGPGDPTALGTPPDGSIDITPDGRSYLYSYSSWHSDLHIIDGLR
jgi:DNA-binding winged helix-turn-helix (wHTH) protein